MTDQKPVATYRLQLNKDFTFDAAAKLSPYFAGLNVSHLYLSPVSQSVEGSMHGYDVEDFSRLCDHRGGAAAFGKLADSAAQANLKLLIDIVPNHMGIAGHNPYWFDILANGRDAQHWSLFDMRVPEGGKLHLPILDRALDDLIEEGELKLERHDRFGVMISVKGRLFPVNAALQKDFPQDGELPQPDAGEMRELLEKQHYKFVIWTESFDTINYRRFFDIMDLAAVRVEDEKIFQIAHKNLIELAGKYPVLDGVRVDHVDGLSDPEGYLQKLSKYFDKIWVEKILNEKELLPASWPVEGTTGYEFISYLNQMLIDPKGMQQLERYWQHRIEPKWSDFHSCVTASKENALRTLFGSELKRIVGLTSDNDSEAEKADLFWAAMTICLPVYRTYLANQVFSQSDFAWIGMAEAEADRVFGAAFIGIKDEFMHILQAPRTEKEAQAVREWQQLSGPAMAKGLEDTAHYRYFPLAAMNEVGCEPGDIRSREDLLFWLNDKLQSHPGMLAASSTHDTKRSEDARCRLYALASMPDQWIAFFEEASALKQGHPEISILTEYFFYQAVIASWPLDGRIGKDYADRLCAYMQKAMRENRTQTSWLKQDKNYEAALEKFVRATLADSGFITRLQAFIEPVLVAGAVNSLSALTLKMLSGLVPDIYQGTEMWNFSLVDPDNRRPVDFAAHSAAFAQLEKPSLSDLAANWQDGSIKLWLTQVLLRIRRDHLVGAGGLLATPLAVSGPDADRVVAYTLKNGKSELVVIVPRYPDGQSLLPRLDAVIAVEGRYADLLDTREFNVTSSLKMSEVFRNLPVAVLRKI